MADIAPFFFVHDIAVEQQEEVYANLAKLCRAVVPAKTQRIHSLRYSHDGAHWHAIVGQQLTGFRRVETGPRNRRSEHVQQLSDSAFVVAIFDAERVFQVVTDGGDTAGRRSSWANPFLAGRDSSPAYFADDLPQQSA